MENHERAVEIHAFRVVSEESKEPLLHLNGSFGQVNSKRLLGGQGRYWKYRYRIFQSMMRLKELANISRIRAHSER
jgi:hypothetical protein